MNSISKTSSKKPAFTLIELLVSVSIIGIMAAVSISGYPRFSQQVTLSTDTYKMLGYLRETQAYGVSAISTPGTKVVYGFKVTMENSDDPDSSTIKRYILENPTGNTNSYYISSSVLDTSANVVTVKSMYEISQIEGVKSGATSSLTSAYGFFRRPNPEARLVGKQGDVISDTGTASFDKIIVTLRSKNNNAFAKKVVILATGQMYINDW